MKFERILSILWYDQNTMAMHISVCRTFHRTRLHMPFSTTVHGKQIHEDFLKVIYLRNFARKLNPVRISEGITSIPKVLNQSCVCKGYKSNKPKLNKRIKTKKLYCRLKYNHLESQQNTCVVRSPHKIVDIFSDLMISQREKMKNMRGAQTLMTTKPPLHPTISILGVLPLPTPRPQSTPIRIID